CRSQVDLEILPLPAPITVEICADGSETPIVFEVPQEEIDACSTLGSEVVVPFNSSGTWQVPAGVTQITVEAWGGGGRGGARTSGNNVALAGGGGGAYSKSTLSVTPLQSYPIV